MRNRTAAAILIIIAIAAATAVAATEYRHGKTAATTTTTPPTTSTTLPPTTTTSTATVEAAQNTSCLSESEYTQTYTMNATTGSTLQVLEVPYGARGQLTLSVVANATVEVGVYNVTGPLASMLPEPRSIALALTPKPTEKYVYRGTLSPGAYIVEVNNTEAGSGESTLIHQNTTLTYTQNTGQQACSAQNKYTATTTLQPPYYIWLYTFFVPQNTKGTLSIKYTATNAVNLKISVTQPGTPRISPLTSTVYTVYNQTAADYVNTTLTPGVYFIAIYLAPTPTPTNTTLQINIQTGYQPTQ